MKKKVEVVLLKNVAKLGKHTQVVNVSAGYARNYLLPNGLALLYDKAGKNYIQLKLSSKDKLTAKIEQSKEYLINELSNKVLLFERKVSKKGTLYGSINTSDIINEIKKITGVKILSDMIILSEHIKKPGEYDYTLILSPEVQHKLKFRVDGIK